MSEPLTTSHPIRAIVQRHITEDETVSFEGVYETEAQARAAVVDQLALCRDHMRKYNEEVILVHRKTSDEIDAKIAERGAELNRLEARIAEARMRGKRLGLGDQPIPPVNGPTGG